ncbi:putative cytochrome P450 49a1 like protein [Argiope bruennichi]|uniref:Putative cytochrome P450 49a1 like protein n=1 Tax=Argiope bruennichi TaxID=94029 RepID=A0A8T0F415_ARGBR|nr:putative cytochrome P450 49a1 like protein [Argiope bruennichi]
MKSLRHLRSFWKANQKIRCSSSTVNSEIDLQGKPFSEIPSLPALPILGASWHYMPIIGKYRIDEQHKANKEKRKRYGDIFREKIGKLDIVVTFSAEDMHEIYLNEGRDPFRVNFESVVAYRKSRPHWYSTAGVVSSHGEEWRELRFKTQEYILKPAAALWYLEPFRDVSEEFVRKLYVVRDSNDEVPNFLMELYKWNLESICLIGLNTRLGCLDTDLDEDSDGIKIINSVQTKFDCIIKLEAFSRNFQLWKYFSTPTWKKFVKCSDTFSEIAFKHINSALLNLEPYKEDHEKPSSFLQVLIKNKSLDVQDIMVVLADFLMAGIEATAHSIGFLLYHLARNPEKQDLLYKEIMSFLPTKDAKLINSNCYELKYLQACFKESLRLNPPVGGSARTLDRDIVLSGYIIPAGTLLTVPYQELFTQEKYCKEPLKFIPERWLKGDEDKPKPWSFLPFGFGCRSCMGRRLAELQIIRNFQVEYHLDDIGTKTMLVNSPDKPLRFNFIER